MCEKMKTVRNIIILSILLICLTSCKAKVSDVNSEEPAVQEKTDAEKAAADAEKKAQEQAEIKKNIERAKKLTKEGQYFKPITDIKFDISDIQGNLSNDDANRSYVFRKSAIKRCYLISLADDLETAGDVSMSLKYLENGKTAVENYKSTIENDDFNHCMQNAAAIWKLPPDTSMNVSFNFSSRPAPTIEDLKQLNYDHGHGHDHAHGADADEVHEHELDEHQENPAEHPAE